MTRGVIAGGACLLLALAAVHRALERDGDPAVAAERGAAVPTATTHVGLLHGRVTLDDGETYEGRLRWGGDEEALWGNYFNGFRDRNPWVALAPADRLPKERITIGLFGFEILGWDRRLDLGRPFMARFGDIARIDARGRDLRVTLRSGTVFELDRFSADDLADGLRVWDGRRGVVDLDEWRIRTIELVPAPRPGDGPLPLHATVRTAHGDFTGLIQWDREMCLGSDELLGNTSDGPLAVRFDAIRSITRRSEAGALVTLLDGSEVVLSDTRAVGRGHRGIYVDDPRYGRVLVSWDAFVRADFGPHGTGPAWADFAPGTALTGSVVTRSGQRFAGRLVYDLDESETTETLDAPSRGVDYTIPFGRVASIVLPDPDGGDGGPARVTLRDGEVLPLERAGDLGDANAGVLVFVVGRRGPEYVPWAEVRRVDFDDPGARDETVREPAP